MMHRIWIAVFAVSGCATTTPGAGAHEMSASQHEAAARSQDTQAAEHAEAFDPNTVKTRPCRGAPTRVPADVCWTSLTNPTDVHRQEAEKHRRMAADHRAGSAALGQAESQACVGLSPHDRDISPFDQQQDITNVEPLNISVGGSKQPSQRTVGAKVSFRAVDGITVEWLQRVMECHLARNAALGHVVPDMPNCPLVLPGVEAHVSSTGNGFVVALSSNDSATAQEIRTRAQRLIGPKP